MRVWVIDDESDIREGVVALIRRLAPDARVTGRFSLGADALRASARGETFDIALVDLGLPDMNGDEVIRRLRCGRPRAGIIAFTVRCDDGAVFSALRAGASGYITKDVTDEELLVAVQSASTGAAPFSADVSRRVATSFWTARPDRARNDGEVAADLTGREREVLDLLSTGASYREVGRELGITLGTVQTHVKSVYGKLGVGTKTEAMRWSLGLPLSPR